MALSELVVVAGLDGFEQYASILPAKRKYTPHADIGDRSIILNATRLALPQKRLIKKFTTSTMVTTAVRRQPSRSAVQQAVIFLSSVLPFAGFSGKGVFVYTFNSFYNFLLRTYSPLYPKSFVVWICSINPLSYFLQLISQFLRISDLVHGFFSQLFIH